MKRRRSTQTGPTIDQDPESQTQPKTQNNNQSSLPQCLLIEEIFSRLPIKSLIRFKSLSKQWSSIISSAHFAKLHRKHHPLIDGPKHHLLIDIHGDLHIYHDDLLLRRLNGRVYTDFNPKLTEPIGSCNGLVCSIQGSDYYFVWNPLTRKHRKMAPLCATREKADGPCYALLRGFGYVSSMDDYKIIHVRKCMCKQPGVEVGVFSLRAGVWRVVNVLDDELSFLASLCGKVDVRLGAALVNEALHWLVTLKNAPLLTGFRIVAFGLAGEELFDLPRPPVPLVDVANGEAFVSVLDRWLCFCNVLAMHGSMDVWVLEEYRDRGPWRMLFRLDLGMRLMGSKLLNWNLYGEFGRRGSRVLVRPYGGGPQMFVDFTRAPLKQIASLPVELFVSFGISYVGTLASPFPAPEDGADVVGF